MTRRTVSTDDVVDASTVIVTRSSLSSDNVFETLASDIKTRPVAFGTLFAQRQTENRWQLVYSSYLALLQCAYPHYCSFTNTPAMPIPVPTHILVTPIFWFRLLSSERRVTTCLVPVAPSGWPIALNRNVSGGQH
jgi:hypothetical protein